MAEKKNKKTAKTRIDENDRLKYIGFEVFPGKIKDLFKSDAEKTKLIDAIRKRRQRGDILREQCTLMEERVTFGDRLVMTLACGLVLAALFMPWFSAYNEIEEVVEVTVAAEPVDSLSFAAESDSLAVDSLDAMSDSTLLAVASTEAATGAEAEDDTTAAVVAEVEEGPREEIIHGLQARKRYHKEFARLSGFGSLFSIGSVGGMVFSSGFVLMLTGLLLLIYLLTSIALPVYTIYGLYGLKGDADTKALQLKKIVKFSWIPVIIFCTVMILSFFGAEYSFAAPDHFSSLSDSYGPGIFLDSISWGVLISFCCFLLVAVKGSEI